MELILCDYLEVILPTLFGKLDHFTAVNILSHCSKTVQLIQRTVILLPNIIVGLAPRFGSNKTFNNFLRPLFLSGCIIARVISALSISFWQLRLPYLINVRKIIVKKFCESQQKVIFENTRRICHHFPLIIKH